MRLNVTNEVSVKMCFHFSRECSIILMIFSSQNGWMADIVFINC